MRAQRLLVWLLVVCGVLGVFLFGCKRRESLAAEVAPPPVVTDASTELLFTWIDEGGEFHVETRVAAVPENARAVVRVRDPARDMPSGRAFVADLRAAGPDGRYPVRETSRAEFEDVAVERRRAHGGVLSARPPGSVPDEAPAVIIYGAEWCGPCHQAAEYLEGRHVSYVKKDIEKDGGAAREMHAKLAKAGRSGGSIPVLDVRGTILVGFSPSAVDAALRAQL